MGVVKSALIKIFPAKLVLKLYSLREIIAAKRVSYSLEGEDIVLNNLFQDQAKGFYVDIGANHPKMHSNTYFFYKKGWSGINVDAAPGSMQLFNLFRRRDVNLEIPVSNTIEALKYFMFDQPRVNSFSEELSRERERSTSYRIIKEVLIETTTLKNILDKHLENGVMIDFLTIDVEGFDFNVLQSNDWEKYKPRVIVVEELDTKENDREQPTIYNYLHEKGYDLIAKTGNSCIYCLASDSKLAKYLACKIS